MTKTIDIKSLLIGFLLATSVMLFMGAGGTTHNTTSGKYQGIGTGTGLFLLNTHTGETYRFNFVKESNSFWEIDTRNQHWVKGRY
tara:strand:- start:331 stop:585 length:255 start_codon:yes stop_codon:yes gene_type:complete